MIYAAIVLALWSAVAPAKPARVTILGRAEVAVADYKERSERIVSILPDAPRRGKALPRLRLISQKPWPRSLRTDTRIKVTGVRRGDHFDVEKLELVDQQERVSAIEPYTFGDQKILMILVNFANAPTTIPYTKASAEELLRVTLSDFWRENSFNQTWASGDVAGWYTIASQSTGCDYNTISAQARSAATVGGYVLTNYDRYVIAFPQNGCGWWGLGTVGGHPSTAWVNGGLVLQVVAHECGHNLGMDHSHSLACNAGACTSNEYGDSYCTMGYSAGHYNAVQKELLGWLNHGASPSIPTVTSGTYALDPYETTAGIKAIKIAGSPTYYVEYRTKAGFDSTIGSGVLVHSAPPPNDYGPNLRDADPGSGSVFVLAPGKSYVDTVQGVTITTVSIGGQAAISVSRSGVPTGTPGTPVATTTVTAVAVTPTKAGGTTATATPTKVAATPTQAATPGAVCREGFDADGPLGAPWSVIRGNLAVSGQRLVNAPAAATMENLAIAAGCGSGSVSADFVVLAEGGVFGVVARYAGGSYLMAYRQTGGTSVLRIVKKIGTAAEQPLASVSMPNPVRGTPWNLSLTVAGSTLTATVTSIGGTVERRLVATDTSLAAGSPGVMLRTKVQQAADNFVAR